MFFVQLLFCVGVASRLASIRKLMTTIESLIYQQNLVASSLKQPVKRRLVLTFR